MHKILLNRSQVDAIPCGPLEFKLLKMKPLHKSHKLDNVCYDIRGPIAAQARKMEDEGHRILKLNIGNPAPNLRDNPYPRVICYVARGCISAGNDDAEQIKAINTIGQLKRYGIPSLQR
jgi:hypothetical protein